MVTLGVMKAKPIIEIYRSKGFCGLYNRVDQEYMGVLNGRDWWILTCENPGFNYCRMHYANLNRQNGLKDYEIENLNNALDAVGHEVDSVHRESGTMVIHYLNQLDDGTSVNVYVQVNWENNPANASQTHITFEIL